MPESTAVRGKRDGVISMQSSGAAESYTTSREPGDFTYSAPGYAVIRTLDRGEFSTVRRTDAQPITGAFSVNLTDIGDPTTTFTTLPDICEQRGYVPGNWTSTFGNASDEFAVDLLFLIDGTAFGEADKTLTFGDTSVRGSMAEGDTNTYSVTFELSALAPTLS